MNGPFHIRELAAPIRHTSLTVTIARNDTNRKWLVYMELRCSQLFVKQKEKAISN
jgi:hypothetical protein